MIVSISTRIFHVPPTHSARIFDPVSIVRPAIRCEPAAFTMFGKGRHRAGLNFGDCFAYAAASVAGDSLLFVGDDFRKTDIEVA